MKLENQVISLDLAKRLKELGVKQDGVFVYHEYDVRDKSKELLWRDKVNWRDADKKRFFSAFTVAELGEMLGRESNQIMCDGDGTWASVAEPLFGITESASEADARAKMLIYLLENKLISSASA